MPSRPKKKGKQLFFVGDLVRTDFHSEGGPSAKVERRIIEAYTCSDADGGWLYTADGGTPCPTCKHTPYRETPPICGSWFVLVSRRKRAWPS